MATSTDARAVLALAERVDDCLIEDDFVSTIAGSEGAWIQSDVTVAVAP